MRTPDGRAYLPDSIAERDRTKGKSIDVLKRRSEKPAPVVPPAGGSMQGFTRVKPSSAFWSTQGPIARDWTFDTTVDQSPFDKPVLQLGGGGAYFGPTEPGHYSVRVAMQFTVTGTPTGVLIQANVNSLDLSEYGETWARADFDGRWRAAFPVGPFYCDGTSTPLGLQAILSGSGLSPGTLLPATMIDVWRWT